MLTLSGSKNPREGSEESWDGKLRGSGQNHRILLVPRGGWVPLVKALPSPPPRLLPSSSPKVTFPNQRASAPSLGPLHDCLGSGDQPKFPPHFPHHCARCGCGGWVGAGPSWQWSLGGPLPAESAFPVPAEPGLLTQHFLQPAFQRQQMGQHSPQPPALSPSSPQSPTERSFLSCLPWAARDKEERGPSRPV